MPGVNYGRAVMKMRPDWQPGQTARPLDVVYYQNCLWACLRETSALPSLASADWMLSVRSVESDLTGAAEGQVLTVVKVGQELKAQYKALPTYGINDINGLAVALNGKSPTGHTHAVGDITGAASAARKINTTAPLSGGGDLTADRTFKINIGKGLKVDSNLLVLAVKEGSGLVMDSKTGELYFDPSQMPTDQFEALLKSIRVPIWLSKNTTWYVDAASGSDQNDGTTAAKAFKTLQYALNYISENYNFGSFIATLQVAAGTYDGFTVPLYSASTGYLRIMGASSETVVIQGTDGVVISTQTGGGTLAIQNATLKQTVTSAGHANQRKTILYGASGVTINLTNVIFRHIEEAGAISNNCNTITCDGEISFYTGCTMDIQGQPPASSKIRVMLVQATGNLAVTGDIVVNGSFQLFASVNGGRWSRSSALPVITGTAVGKRYQIQAFGVITVRGGGEEYLPGNAAGSISNNNQYA